MTQNLTESVKIVKNALEANGVYPHAVNKNKDGHIVVRNTFFYKSGRTSEGHAHKIKKALDAAGIKHSIVDNGEHNAPFRGGASVAKSCHFYTHVKLHEDAEINEVYLSAAAMSRKAKAVKQARAVANGYANQKSGKWSSQSYKTEDGRWAAKDVKEEAEAGEFFEPGTRVYNKVNKQRGIVLRPNRDLKNRALLAVKYDNGTASAHKAHVLVKEETLIERYKRAMGRATLREASAGTLVSTKGSDKASRYEMHTNMPGEASEYSSTIKTHQDGKPLQNRWGGYNTLRTGKTAYVKKHFAKLDEEVLDEGAQTRSGAFAFTHTPGDTDSEEKLTKLKKMVKAHNIVADEHSKLRVTARGRLGKDNPEADKYRKGGEVWNAKSRPAGTYDANHKWTPKADGSRKRGEMRDLPMQDAKHHDIYVHPAPNGWDKPGFQERYAKDPYNKISTNHAKSLISAHKAICENVEQIDELSKATLGSYVKKASNDVASKAVEYGTKKAERDEVDRITNRHMKYADKDTVHQALKTTSDDVEAPRVKAAKRIGGIAKAVNKLTNEETTYSHIAIRSKTGHDEFNKHVSDVSAALRQHMDAHGNAPSAESGQGNDNTATFTNMTADHKAAAKKFIDQHNSHHAYSIELKENDNPKKTAKRGRIIGKLNKDQEHSQNTLLAKTAISLIRQGYTKRPGKHGPDGNYDHYSHPHGDQRLILRGSN